VRKARKATKVRQASAAIAVRKANVARSDSLACLALPAFKGRLVRPALPVELAIRVSQALPAIPDRLGRRDSEARKVKKATAVSKDCLACPVWPVR
jgi:hypothetical protein